MSPRLLRTSALLAAAASLAACAKKATAPATEAPAPAPGDAAASAGARATRLTWSGSLQPTQQRTGSVAPTGQTKAYGTVTLTASPNGDATVARITLSAPVTSPSLFRWAVLPGRCGAGSVPLLAVEQFPAIEVGTNGRGEMSGTVPLQLPTAGTFHVNVYWQGQQLTDVMTCGNLTMRGGVR